MADDGDDDYHVPLQDQRVFGAGMKRKPITFVPASNLETNLPTPGVPNSNIAARYLSIVLPKEAGQRAGESAALTEPLLHTAVCSVCKHPISYSDKSAVDAHETSIAHQVCLEHSYQPSHLDPTHVGVRYLETYGWDPNSRKGLGARGEGIRIPVKAKEKKDTSGLRETVDEDNGKAKRKTNVEKDDKVVRLNAKQIRIKDMEDKKRAERLRKSFYGQDLEKYLGPNS